VGLNEGYYSTLKLFARLGILHNLAQISGKTDMIFMKIFVSDVSLDKKIPLHFLKSSCSIEKQRVLTYYEGITYSVALWVIS